MSEAIPIGTRRVQSPDVISDDSLRPTLNAQSMKGEPVGKRKGGGEDGSKLGSSFSEIEDLEPLPPTVAIIDANASISGHSHSRRHRHSIESNGNASTSSSIVESPTRAPIASFPSSLQHSDDLKPRRSSNSSSQRRSSITNPSDLPLSARYVTVSSILSRSGAALPLSPPMGVGIHSEMDENEAMPARRRLIRRRSTKGSTTPAPNVQTILGPRSSGGSVKSSNGPTKRASNGSALEALGALFLQRDSIGKVSNLSFLRDSTLSRERRKSKTRKGNDDRQSLSNKFTFGLTSVSRGWLERMSGSSKVGIRMPNENDAGQTIAQRRARRGMAMDNETGPRFESTKNNEPCFEVLIRNPIYPLKVSRSTVDENFTPPAAPRLAGRKGDDLTPPPLEEEMIEEESFEHRTFLQNNGPMTEPIKGVYGPGSAFSWLDPPELPPSPIGMPGAWSMGSYGWNKEEGALLLPPPLLDDQGSDAKSFEGLLGVRRMREQERQRKEFEKLKARNRPAHKVGMLTAFSNFVKAAHAADKAARSSANLSRAPPLLQRRHTEPAEKNVVIDEEEDDEDDKFSDIEGPTKAKTESFDSALLMKRTGSLTRSSMDSTSRQLDTVYEVRSPNFQDYDEDPQEDEEDRKITKMRRTASEDVDRRASRVPVHLTENGEKVVHARSVDEGILAGSFDQLNASYSRNGSTGPTTPRIGPTMLSLPPSPWTPYGGASRSGHQTPFQFHLGMTPVFGPPGTPRLIPAMLEIAPSPFPMLGGMTPFLRSPRGSDNINQTYIANPSSIESGLPNINAPSPLALSPSESPVLAPFASIGQRLNEENINEHNRELDVHTPKPIGTSASSRKSVRLDDDISAKEKGEQSKTNSRIGSTGMGKRSFLLWFLFGDLGLGSRSTIAAKAAGSPAPFSSKKYSQFYVIVLSIAAHIYGFSVFILAHLVDLGYRIAEFLSMAFWFLRWMILNLSGQTVLARCAIDAYGVVSREWETVAREDHEWKGLKNEKDDIEKDPSLRKYRGLTKWQVMKGMVELVCLQDVTRERYLEEGAGLEELKGWKRRKYEVAQRETNQDSSTLPATPSRIDLGLRRAADRKAKDEKDEKDAFHARQKEQMLAEKQESDSENEEDDEESESESSDDDMVVTRRGADVLEFTKTPKVETVHSYFPSSEDGMEDDYPKRPSRFSKRSLSGASHTSAQPLPSEPVNRHLVRLIKWASRLAISAYGLHVTLVDLPATFTPSGNRFSRQTFAHLSRLHHEDVLHADIQTLDSDDYSPTFYLVRDLKRKIVVVSVRGTQSLQDIIVDLEMVVDQFKLQDENLSSNPEEEVLYCHAGILRAARALVAKDSTLFKTLNQALREHPDFGIVFTGHSLGGAIASTVVLLLSKYEESNKTMNGIGGSGDAFDHLFDWEENRSSQSSRQGKWITHDHSGLPAGRPIRAITFAHPATVNATLAERAARGRTPLVLSVVLGHDIIPRCGHGQARELRRVLGALSRVRRRKEYNSLDSRRGSTSTEPEELFKNNLMEDDIDPRVHIFTSWWNWRKLKRKPASSMTKQEEMRMFTIEKELWRLRCDVESDLYSAVKRRTEESRLKNQLEKEKEGEEEQNIHLSTKTKDKSTVAIPPSPWIGPSHKAPLHQLAARRQTLDSVTLANEEQISKSAGVLVPAGRSIWIYEGKLFKVTSPLSFFSLPDFHPKMFSEHFPSAYEDQLEGL